MGKEKGLRRGPCVLEKGVKVSNARMDSNRTKNFMNYDTSDLYRSFYVHSVYISIEQMYAYIYYGPHSSRVPCMSG